MTYAVHDISLQLECCGSESPLDWKRSAFNKHFDDTLVREIGIPKSQPNGGASNRFLNNRFNIPQSCCKEPNTPECMTVVRQVDPEAMPYVQIHKHVSLSPFFICCTEFEIVVK